LAKLPNLHGFLIINFISKIQFKFCLNFKRVQTF
jgi:hypothetical protein